MSPSPQLPESEGMMPDAARREGVQLQLTRWYEASHRDLPWRRSADPYAIWVSEIMLQQTQVETVKPYFERFMAAFPTARALAQAPEQAVLSLWAGLGYYSRARNLQRGAQVVVEQFGGALPASVDALLKIPGVGPYTAGAIASIAYGVPAAVLDGNVIRVLSRLFHLTTDPSSTRAKRHLWALAQALVPEQGASSFNQGLMELGALVCTPRSPRCELCPLSGGCESRAIGDQAELPVKVKRAPRPHQEVVAGIVRDQDGRLLMALRPSEGLLGGLWDFPLVSMQGPKPASPRGGRGRPGGRAGGAEAMPLGGAVSEGDAPVVKGKSPSGGWHLSEALRWRTGLQVQVGERLEVVDHLFTHLSLRVNPVLCEHIGGGLSPQPPAAREGVIVAYVEWRWVSLEEALALPVGKVVATLLRVLGQGGGQLRLL